MLTVKEDVEGSVVLTASYDMGWQRRSSGRAYNSRSGHGVLVGEISGRILNYGSRIINCKQCEVYMVSGNEKCHDCRINWDGSSKCMESDLAVELINESKTSDFRVGTSDEDATTINTVKKCADHKVEKLRDSNHAKNTVGNSLYVLQKSIRSCKPKLYRIYRSVFPTV